MILMPLLVLGFYALQLDRSNIGNALTDTLTTDLNITKDDVNTGDQLMMAGIIIAEIPSNILLQKLGAPIWLTGQVLIWGTVLGYQRALFLCHSVPIGVVRSWIHPWRPIYACALLPRERAGFENRHILLWKLLCYCHRVIDRCWCSANGRYRRSSGLAMALHH